MASSTEKAKRVAIYRKVARLYEQDGIASGTCDTLKEHLKYWPDGYAQLFAPKELDGEYRSPWFVCVAFGDQLRDHFGINKYGLIGSEKAREFRVLALCFMAAMVEAGDA